MILQAGSFLRHHTKKSILQELQKGVCDIPAGSGLQHMVGSVPLEVLDRVLSLTVSGETVKIDRVEMVDPRFVLARAWHPDRLEPCRDWVAEGMPGDPVRLSGMRFPGLPVYYAVSDGMHRTVAARLAGKNAILAKVLGHWICDVNRCRVVDNTTYHLDVSEDHWRQWGSSESDDTVDLLQLLGVSVQQTWHKKLRLLAKRFASTSPQCRSNQ